MGDLENRKWASHSQNSKHKLILKMKGTLAYHQADQNSHFRSLRRRERERAKNILTQIMAEMSQTPKKETEIKIQWKSIDPQKDEPKQTHTKKYPN